MIAETLPSLEFIWALGVAFQSSQRITDGAVSPCSVWVLVIELKSLDLAARSVLMWPFLQWFFEPDMEVYCLMNFYAVS